MRKGILSLIAIYTLIQIAMYLLLFIILVVIIAALPDAPEDNIQIVIGIFYLISNFIGFILMGFGLKKKYSNSVKYWKFIIVGALISILTTLILVGTIVTITNLTDTDTFDLEESFYMFIGMFFMMYIPCLLVGLFHSKLKGKKQFNNSEALDASLLNDE